MKQIKVGKFLETRQDNINLIKAMKLNEQI